MLRKTLLDGGRAGYILGAEKKRDKRIYTALHHSMNEVSLPVDLIWPLIPKQMITNNGTSVCYSI